MNDYQQPATPTKHRRRTIAIIAIAVAIMAAGVTLTLTSRPQKQVFYGPCGTWIKKSVIQVVPAVIPPPIIGHAEPPVTELACSIS